MQYFRIVGKKGYTYVSVCAPSYGNPGSATECVHKELAKMADFGDKWWKHLLSLTLNFIYLMALNKKTNTCENNDKRLFITTKTK